MNGVDGLVRLDLAGNPYGASPAALDAIEMLLESSTELLVARLRRRLGDIYRVPIESILFLENADTGLNCVVGSYPGPIVGFPPSSSATKMGQLHPARETISVVRGPGRAGVLDPDPVSDIPETAVAAIDSPSDPLGALLCAADAVRLSRACTLLVIDERFAEFAGFSLLPLTTEFDNIIILRSLEAWTGLPDESCAWAVAAPRTVATLGFEEAALAPAAVAAALATLENLDSVTATLTLFRQERSRLYRLLRKFSFLEPLPSWGPFVSARVDIVPRESIVTGLLEKGIQVHAPMESGLERFVRFGIGTGRAMDRLKSALIELGPRLLG